MPPALRIPICCAILVLTACGEDVGPRTVTLSGQLVDSLAGLPIDSQRVHFAIGMTLDSTTTNQSGEFAITVPPGPVHLSYTDFGRYEALERIVIARRDTAFVLQLRRTLPFLRDFSITAAGALQATIVDLQGAATLAQDNATWVVYQDPAVIQSSAIPAAQWTWTPIDALTWRVSVATPSTAITAAIWNIMDDQYPTGFYCLAGQSACTPDAP